MNMSNPLNDIDDVDDDLFISKKPQNYIFAEKKAIDIQERTNKSLSNTISLVQESEKIGQSTLENLSSQRETLERVENDLDGINSMTRSTQKHLNNIGSFFGWFKSPFSSSNSNAVATTTVPSTSRGMTRSATLAHVPSGGPVSTSNSHQKPASSDNRSVLPNSSSRIPSKTIEQPGDEYEANLSEIGFGLGRLKEMAMKLGDEIEDQNDMLDRVTEKSERAGDSIKHQNRQMQRLLKKG